MKIFRFLKFSGSCPWPFKKYKADKDSAGFLLLLWLLLFLLLLLYARYVGVIHVDGQVSGGQAGVVSKLPTSASVSTSTLISTSITTPTPTPTPISASNLTSDSTYTTYSLVSISTPKAYIDTATSTIAGSSTIRDTSRPYQPGFGGGGSGSVGSSVGGDDSGGGNGGNKVDIIKSAKDLGIPICK